MGDLLAFFFDDRREALRDDASNATSDVYRHALIIMCRLCFSYPIRGFVRRKGFLSSPKPEPSPEALVEPKVLVGSLISLLLHDLLIEEETGSRLKGIEISPALPLRPLKKGHFFLNYSFQ